MQLLERITRTAPLGLRFWDSLSGQVVRDGLQVSAALELQPQRPARVSLTPSGVFSISEVPGLRSFERPTSDADPWSAPLPSQRLLVQVRDAFSRFVPFGVRITAPQRGLWSLPFDSPFGASPAVPLFSAPTRPVPGGVGVVRAQVVDPTANGGQGGPAAWAVLEASVPGQPAVRSIADGQGRIALLVPYPPPSTVPLAGVGGSPLIGTSPAALPLSEQRWQLTIRAAYAPRTGLAGLPELVETLEQPAALIWADQARTHLLEQAELRYGRETLLVSGDPSGRSQSSVLFIQAGSPL